MVCSVENNIKAGIADCICKLIRTVKCRISAQSQFCTAKNCLLIDNGNICRFYFRQNVFEKVVEIVGSVALHTAFVHAFMNEHIANHHKVDFGFLRRGSCRLCGCLLCCLSDLCLIACGCVDCYRRIVIACSHKKR